LDAYRMKNKPKHGSGFVYNTHQPRGETTEMATEKRDFVRLLRALSADLIEMDEPDASATCVEAAERIEALEAENARLKHQREVSEACNRAKTDVILDNGWSGGNVTVHSGTTIKTRAALAKP
jgi:isopropylmalate/homocitrate/citramalate synthase